MRREKTILDKSKSLENNALMAPAIYRLLTYTKWENIPEKYKLFFPKEAAEVWNDDLKDFKDENILLDVDTELKAIYKVLMERAIVQASSLIPILLADIFVLGYPITRHEIALKKALDTFINNYEVDQANAEYIAMLDIITLLERVIKQANLEIKKDLKVIHTKLLDEYTKVKTKLKVLNNLKEEEYVYTPEATSKPTDL